MFCISILGNRYEPTKNINANHKNQGTLIVRTVKAYIPERTLKSLTVIINGRPQTESDQSHVLDDVQQTRSVGDQPPICPDVRVIVGHVVDGNHEPGKGGQDDGRLPDGALWLVVADGRWDGRQHIWHSTMGGCWLVEEVPQWPADTEDEGRKGKSNCAEGYLWEGNAKEYRPAGV